MSSTLLWCLIKWFARAGFDAALYLSQGSAANHIPLLYNHIFEFALLFLTYRSFLFVFVFLPASIDN